MESNKLSVREEVVIAQFLRLRRRLERKEPTRPRQRQAKDCRSHMVGSRDLGAVRLRGRRAIMEWMRAAGTTNLKGRGGRVAGLHPVGISRSAKGSEDFPESDVSGL
jgi:hypothetical protein